jgi:uncharacterized protein
MLKAMAHILLFFGIFLLVILLAAYFFQHRLIFFPSTLPADHEFRFNMPVEEVFLPAADGVVAHALYFKAGEPRGAVLYFHGNAGDLSSWGHSAEPFVSRGFNVLMPDYRGYGKSIGPLTEQALHDDARLALQHLRKDFADEKIVIYGRSIGSGMAVPLAAGLPLKALVLETPYTSLVDVAKVHYPIIPAGLLLRFRFNAAEAIEKVICPIHIIHGTADRVIPYELGRRLADKARGAVSFHTVPNGGHNDLDRFPEYRQMMEEVFGR